MQAQSSVASSFDRVPIHYDVQGQGATALVFVHGWCCDRHYWDRQVGYFAPHYTVVCLDLAGHGQSGRARTQWTMPAFGQDVVAVVEQLRLAQLVLIGHSMGGPVIVEAARRLSTAVVGLVGVDTWQNVQQTRTPAQVAEVVRPLRANFVEAAQALVRTMFVPTSDATLTAAVVTAMSAAPPPIGIGAMEALLGHDRQLQEGLQEVQAPKRAINAAQWRATDMEAAQRYGIEVVLMSDVGHFVMLEDPPTFNRLLDEAVKQCLHTRAPQ
jgi:pimeloyl-ACP methyl ester carboxylesterase